MKKPALIRLTVTRLRGGRIPWWPRNSRRMTPKATCELERILSEQFGYPVQLRTMKIKRP